MRAYIWDWMSNALVKRACRAVESQWRSETCLRRRLGNTTRGCLFGLGIGIWDSLNAVVSMSM